jgi:hypothetical protein
MGGAMECFVYIGFKIFIPTLRILMTMTCYFFCRKGLAPGQAAFPHA